MAETILAIRRLERLAALDTMAEPYKTRIGYVVALAWLHIKRQRRRALWSSIITSMTKSNAS